MNDQANKAEAFSTAVFLTLSGGFQDAYTYLTRDKVFANGQTGNIVLLAKNLAESEWSVALGYAIPVFSFIIGIYVAEVLKTHFSTLKRFHWSQLVLMIEISILFAVGFISHELNPLANALVSFVCALQVETFRKVKGISYATTMCIGNLRSGTELLHAYHHTKDKETRAKAFQYFEVIMLFALGAAFGGLVSERYDIKAIWVSCGLLAISFLMLFTKGKTETTSP